MKNIETKEKIEVLKNFLLFYKSEQPSILLCKAIERFAYYTDDIEMEKVFYTYYKNKYKSICDFWGKESYGKYVRIEFIESYLGELERYYNKKIEEEKSWMQLFDVLVSNNSDINNKKTKMMGTTSYI